jgi:hypothetical protein
MIQITKDNRTYSLDWNDIHNLVRYAVAQNYSLCTLARDEIFKNASDVKLNSDTFTKEIFFENLQKTVQNYINIYTQYIPTTAKRIVSVGSGISNCELILSQMIPESELFLVDKQELKSFEGYLTQENKISLLTKEDYFSANQFYHSWDVVSDAISASNLNKDRYNFLSPDDDWPNDIDVAMSLYSWCWNYPFEMYSERLLKGLKIDGTLILEIQNLPNNMDQPKIISEAMGSEPIIHQLYKQVTYLGYSNVHRNVDENNIWGGLYIWKRKR